MYMYMYITCACVNACVWLQERVKVKELFGESKVIPAKPAKQLRTFVPGGSAAPPPPPPAPSGPSPQEMAKIRVSEADRNTHLRTA